MFNFCGLYSSNPTKGSYAYETYNRIPSLSQFKYPANQISQSNQILGQNIKRIGSFINQLPVQRQFSTIQNRQFISNVPINSVKASQSNLNNITKQNPYSVVKKILKSDYAEIVHKYKKQKFTDPDFPPNQNSIGDIQKFKVKIQWKRIPEIIRNAQFVNGKIEPSDLFQGQIGNCYFLSAIAALAEKDFRIKNLFPHLEISSQGVYMARILYQGVLRQVVVDDFIPVSPQGIPIFAKPADSKQIWVMILQKCWAKLHGSYSAIQGGLPNEVLHSFSGAPTYSENILQRQDKKEDLWKQMLLSYQQDSILCCSTLSEPSIEKYGFVKGHAYTVLGIFQAPYRMICFRNPWRKQQWNGRASNKDKMFWSKVSPLDKQNMGFKEGDDGQFFILWQDFLNYFDMVDICKINDNASFMSIETQFDKKRGEMFIFQTNGGQATLGLSQKNLQGSKDKNEDYARATLVIAYNEKLKAGYQYKYIGSLSRNTYSDMYLQLTNLKPGKYVIFAKFDWISKSVDSGIISVYSNSNFSLIKSKQSTHDQFLYKTFMDHARNNTHKKWLSNNPQQWVCNDFLLNEAGYGYIAIHLDAKSIKKIGIELNQKDYTEKRLILKKPFKGNGLIKTKIDGGKQLIILYRMKANNYPSSITLPTPKIYQLV